jgi:predicted glycosyltransferase
MTRTALFLVKNGIGYGHIRRALLLAGELTRRSDLRPVIISQARTLDLLRASSVSVLNLPLLHRVPSAVGEDAYHDVLGRVVERLAPAVVVEDTYPDERYDSLRALRGVPRVLVLRRLDGESFDTLRSRQAFARYDRVLLAQNSDELDGESHSGESLHALRYSSRLTAIGNIHHVPTTAEIAAERGRHDGPLVVVNGGAGGDQLHDGYGHRLLAACHRTAATLHAAGHAARFVVVTGPYYAGPPLSPLPNLTVHRFTTALPALLAAADVVVIKPGNNALAEALHGGAHLVLVPDTSFLEGTQDNARRMAERFGGSVVSADGVEAAVRDALARPSLRTRQPPHPAGAIRAATAAVISAAGPHDPQVSSRELCVLVRTAPPHPRLPVWAHGVSPLSDSDSADVVAVADTPPHDRAPQDVVDRGTTLLVSAGPAPAAVARWLRLSPPRPALPTVEAADVAVGPHDPPELVLHALARALDAPGRHAVVLDLRRLGVAGTAAALAVVTRWITEQPIRTVAPDHLLAATANRLLEGRAP